MIKKLRYYWSFTKPGISRAQILTVSIGYFLATQAIHITPIYGYLVVSTYLFSAAACGLNNILEVNFDRAMKRTQQRELVVQCMTKKEAWAVVMVTFVVASVLSLKINVLTFWISILTVGIYVGIYTPLKRVSWMNTYVGALPGALPLIGGWCAAGTPIHMAVIALFLALYCWQIPHFYALAIVYLDDYRAAGFKMLPLAIGGIPATKRQMVIFSVLMVIVSMYPVLAGFLGTVYWIGTVASGGIFLYYVSVSVGQLERHARKVFIISILYLPLWFLIIVADIILK